MGLVEHQSDVVWINRDRDRQSLEGKKIQNVYHCRPKELERFGSKPCYGDGQKYLEKSLPQAIAELMPLPMVVSREDDGIIMYANDHFGHLLGVSTRELVGTKTEDIYYNSTDRLMLLEVLQRDGCVKNYEILVKKADGTPLWVNLSVDSVTVEGDRVFFKTFSDITELKQAEEMLQTLVNSTGPVTGEQFFPALVRHLASSLGVRYVVVSELVGEQLDRVRVLAFWDQEAERSPREENRDNEEKAIDLFPLVTEYDFTGTPCERVVQEGMYLHSDRLESSFARQCPLMNLKAQSYLGIRLLDMTGKPIGLISLLDDKPFSQPDRAKAMVSIFAAQASAELERHTAAKALHETEQRLQIALKAAQVAVWEWDITTGIVRWSDEAEAILGLRLGSLGDTADAYFRVIHSEDRKAVRKAIAQAIVSKSSYSSEHRIAPVDTNTVRWMSCQGNVVSDSSGKVVRLIGTLCDITERKQTEAALIQSEANLRAIFNSSVASILLIGKNHNIKAFNNKASEIIKEVWKKEIKEGDAIDDYVADKDLEKFNRHFDACIKGKRIKIQKKIGSHENAGNWFEINYQPVFNDKSEVMGVCLSALDITERKQAVDAIAKSEERFRSLVQNSSDLITILEPDGTIRYKSPSVTAILGYQLEGLVGKNAFEYIHPEDIKNVREVFTEALKKQGEVVEIAFRVRHANGNWVYLEAVGSNLLNHSEIDGFVINSRDVTERKQQEEWLRLFERAIAANSNGIAIAKAEGDNELVYVNSSFEDITGYSAAEVLGHNCRFLQGRDRYQPALKELRAAIQEGRDCTVVLRNYRKDGKLFWNELRLSPVENDRGQIAHFIGVQTDISNRKKAEEQLIHQAYYDSLTGLPNRAFFMDRLREASIKAKQKHNLFAVLFLDLDRFKVINDSLGHAIGDMLLIVIAHRLEMCLSSEDTIARLSGDHYVMLLENIQGLEEVTAIADKIHQQLKAPFTFEGHEVFISASIGIALSNINYEVPADLMRDADIAMYRAKAEGKARSAVFDKAMHDRAVELLQLEHDLRREIHDVETCHHTSLRVAYQPIVSLLDGRIVGFEALVRWEHPQRGLISPGEFIPLAEETGSIVPLGAWVLREACRQFAAWQAQFPDATQAGQLKISVNLSGKQFLQIDLVEQVDRILKETGLDPICLKLEITESVLMKDTQSAIETLLQLKQRQIHLCLDDFGTGYSSLSHLAKFPIDTLKIDKSFVSNMGMEGKNMKIVQAIVTLAHALGMDVTAEGVERRDQLTELKALGCEDAQGYFFSKALYGPEATALLASSLRC